RVHWRAGRAAVPPPRGSGPFVDAILSDYDSDGPRLVYADWLQEHGEASLAEYIRLDCEYAAAPAGDWAPAQAPRPRAGDRRSRHRAKWLGSLAGPKGRLIRFERTVRGVARVQIGCAVPTFLDRAGTWAKTVALPCEWQAHLSRPGRRLAELFASPHLGRV